LTQKALFNLRKIAARSQGTNILSEAEMAVVRRVLDAGALLEKENFSIAQKILLSFLMDLASTIPVLLFLN